MDLDKFWGMSNFQMTLKSTFPQLFIFRQLQTGGKHNGDVNKLGGKGREGAVGNMTSGSL